MDSQFNSNTLGLKQGSFGMGEEGFMPGSYAYDTANLIPGQKQEDKKITVNLEDSILEE